MAQSKICKVLLTIFALSFIMWFGGSFFRTIVAFDLFVPGADLELKTEFNDIMRMHTVRLYAAMSAYSMGAYIAAFLSLTALLVYIKKEFKLKGWLFMSVILFYISSPIELYLLYYDYNLSVAVFWDRINDFNHKIVQDFFLNRFKSIAIATTSALSFLMILTAILYMVWKPLDKEKELDENN